MFDEGAIRRNFSSVSDQRRFVNAKDKVPRFQGQNCNAHFPDSPRYTLDQCLERMTADDANRPGVQVGEGLIVLDFDNVRDPSTGDITAESQAVLALFPNAYVEVSLSGYGLKLVTLVPEGGLNVFTKNVIDLEKKACQDEKKRPAIEIFQHRTYPVLTGNVIQENVIGDIEPQGLE